MGLVLLIVALGSVSVLAVGILGLLGRLPRNSWAGIRTPYSMANDTNWERVHRFGSPILIFGAVASLSASMAFLPFALAGAVDDSLALGVVIGCAVIIALSAIASWAFGVSKAKAAAGG